MKPLNITIVLPFPSTRPGGGMKIMYEYANRLQERGHYITVMHSLKRPFKKMKSPLWWKQFIFKLRGADRPSWFPLNKNIVSKIVPEITDQYLPDADIVFSTWWEMTFMISALSPSKGKPFNLIQGYEVWLGNQENVHRSYALPVQHLVIANYLQQLISEQTGRVPIHIPNAIDTTRFKITKKIGDRFPVSVIMLYSVEAIKGSSFGLDALQQLKQKFPELKATLFGVFDKPDLPKWIDYRQKPNNLVDLYNSHAIFLSPSLSEGWALPPAEAMACGCAVVCTDIGGHADYAIHDYTALLTPSKDVSALVRQTEKLIVDQQLRVRLATAGNKYLNQNFSWKKSVDLLEQSFYSALQ